MKIFKMNESDWVAAKKWEEAKEWYLGFYNVSNPTIVFEESTTPP